MTIADLSVSSVGSRPARSAPTARPSKRSPRASMLLVLSSCGLFWALVGTAAVRLL